ncbi:MAG TPA: hypothetical protein VFV03_03090 [Solirubrobacteraceae bacterium]|nr:hypothetical protein [Solirubrobacteraceae bacterium]
MSSLDSPNVPERQPPEPWLTKQQLAAHLLSRAAGSSSGSLVAFHICAFGGINRYRVSAVEAWLRQHYNSPAEGD